MKYDLQYWKGFLGAIRYIKKHCLDHNELTDIKRQITEKINKLKDFNP